MPSLETLQGIGSMRGKCCIEMPLGGGSSAMHKSVLNPADVSLIRRNDGIALSILCKGKSRCVRLLPTITIFDKKVRRGMLGLRDARSGGSVLLSSSNSSDLITFRTKLLQALGKPMAPVYVSPEKQCVSIGFKRSRTLRASNSGNTITSAAKTDRKDLVNESDLSKSQHHVLNRFLAGHSLFVTGGAGTGKTALMTLLISKAREKNVGCAVTASTGVAACNIGGTTLHSFLGVSRPSLESIQQAAMGHKEGPVGRRWKGIKVLFVDEISMIDSNLFTCVDKFAKTVRGSDKPFGGLQVICCGDFFQLPPVQKRPFQDKQVSDLTLSKNSSGFAFESSEWKELFPPSNVCILCETFRQSDPEFIEILNAIREGKCSAEQERRLLKGGGDFTDEEATVLCTHKADADAINARRLYDLPGEEVVWTAQESGPEAHLKRLRYNSPARDILMLKAGSRIILNKTLCLEQGLVNGARGIIKHFVGPKRTPVIKFDNDVTVAVGPEVWRNSAGSTATATRTQLPLELAWAISIHKSQGLSFPVLQVQAAKAFENGQIYVAMSRATNLAGLKLPDFSKDLVVASSSVIEYYASVQSQNDESVTLQSSSLESSKNSELKHVKRRLCA